MRGSTINDMVDSSFDYKSDYSREDKNDLSSSVKSLSSIDEINIKKRKDCTYNTFDENFFKSHCDVDEHTYQESYMSDINKRKNLPSYLSKTKTLEKRDSCEDYKLRGNKMNSLKCDRLNSLRSDKLNSLRSDKLNSLKSDKLNSLRSDKINSLKSDRLNSLRSDKMNSLKCDRLNSLRSDKIQSLRSDKINSLRSDKINSLRSDRIRSLKHYKLKKEKRIKDERMKYIYKSYRSCPLKETEKTGIWIIDTVNEALDNLYDMNEKDSYFKNIDIIESEMEDKNNKDMDEVNDLEDVHISCKDINENMKIKWPDFLKLNNLIYYNHILNIYEGIRNIFNKYEKEKKKNKINENGDEKYDEEDNIYDDENSIHEDHNRTDEKHKYKDKHKFKNILNNNILKNKSNRLSLPKFPYKDLKDRCISKCYKNLPEIHIINDENNMSQNIKEQGDDNEECDGEFPIQFVSPPELIRGLKERYIEFCDIIGDHLEYMEENGKYSFKEYCMEVSRVFTNHIIDLVSLSHVPHFVYTLLDNFQGCIKNLSFEKINLRDPNRKQDHFDNESVNHIIIQPYKCNINDDDKNYNKYDHNELFYGNNMIYNNSYNTQMHNNNMQANYSVPVDLSCNNSISNFNSTMVVNNNKDNNDNINGNNNDNINGNSNDNINGNNNDNINGNNNDNINGNNNDNINGNNNDNINGNNNDIINGNNNNDNNNNNNNSCNDYNYNYNCSYNENGYNNNKNKTFSLHPNYMFNNNSHKYDYMRNNLHNKENVISQNYHSLPTYTRTYTNNRNKLMNNIISSEHISSKYNDIKNKSYNNNNNNLNILSRKCKTSSMNLPQLTKEDQFNNQEEDYNFEKSSTNNSEINTNTETNMYMNNSFNITSQTENYYTSNSLPLNNSFHNMGPKISKVETNDFLECKSNYTSRYHN
ncbi:hypothetical protein PRSY57_1318000 [Plasmodium reichenowi]|uniref:Uncharacterized protein n=1 Tax=Plasmodium reichenowi TaxID=5854 RepID=A0A151L6Q1_PLARE|nr:hypothetical protein PRSY57_1318000 [Plasmodium reichenowi]KYN94631.1 hypothetical protein PRSY57_1318000 [Plasmodium reichenowi]